MDETTRLCKGCWRTIEEIIAWSSHDDEAKKQVWALIEYRKSGAINVTPNETSNATLNAISTPNVNEQNP
jgi:predicted Fe-S protein YdhL (DUF1289 family)